MTSTCASNLCPANAPSKLPSSHRMRSPGKWRIAFRLATSREDLDRSVAIIRARGLCRAIATAMHPDPVQTSTTMACRSAEIRCATYSTNSSCLRPRDEHRRIDMKLQPTKFLRPQYILQGLATNPPPDQPFHGHYLSRRQAVDLDRRQRDVQEAGAHAAQSTKPPAPRSRYRPAPAAAEPRPLFHRASLVLPTAG